MRPLLLIDLRHVGMQTAEKEMKLAEENGTKARYYELLKDSTAQEGAQKVATVIIQAVFEAHPSATGTYGDIPQGRK